MQNVEDIYPLSPMQEAMLLRSTSDSKSQGLINQFVYRLHGDLNAPALEAAWSRLHDRHPALRTAFVSGKKSGPLQAVRKTVDVHFHVIDWRRAENFAQQWLELAERERQSLSLPAAPLNRLAVVRTDSMHYQLLWTCHHLIMDRWCIDTIWSELATLYSAICRDDDARLPPARPFSDYIRWLKQNDEAASAAFWTAYLRGFTKPTHLCRGTFNGQSSQDAASCTVNGATSENLSAMARSRGVTPNVVLQAGIACLMNQMTLSQDVVFGQTVSGRPPDLSGVTGIVGTFVGNVAVRATLARDQTIGKLLQDLHDAQLARSGHDHVAPSTLQQCSELAPQSAMFDTILVTQAATSEALLEGMTVDAVDGQLVTALPATIGLSESDDEIKISVCIASGHRASKSAQAICDQLQGIYRNICELGGDAILGDLPGFFGEASPQSPVLTGTSTTSAGTFAATSDTGTTARGREATDAATLRLVLRRLWCLVLDLKQIDSDRSFFEHGGDSLKAAALHARVETMLRVRIPLISLFRDPTLEAMSQLLVDNDWPSVTSPVLYVRKPTDRDSTLFMIASPEVNTVGYAMLAGHLSNSLGAAVVQSPPDNDAIVRLDPGDLPAVAAEYVDAILEHQNSGPFYLLGMCTGAQISLEMARLLTRQGHSIAFLGIINTWAHYTVSNRYRWARKLNKAGYYMNRIRDLTAMPATERNAIIARVTRRLIGRQPEEPKAPDTTVAETPALDNALLVTEGTYHDPWIEDYGWAHRNPGGDPFDGEVVVFRLRPQQWWRTGETDLGWGLHATTTSTVNLPGWNHDAILREPGVQNVAKALEQQLSQHSLTN